MKNSKRILKWLMRRTWQPYVAQKQKSIQNYRVGTFHLEIHPGVFHPGYFFSTKYLIKFLSGIQLHNKKVLELGCGSALISLVVEKNGGVVTATDISEQVIRNAILNAKKNNANIRILKSDLFDSLGTNFFDIIIVNPPFFKKNPVNESDFAWYCGNELQYFKKFFSQVKNHIHSQSSIYMILSDECDIDAISSMSQEHQLSFIKRKTFVNLLEKNFIFEIQLLNHAFDK